VARVVADGQPGDQVLLIERRVGDDLQILRLCLARQADLDIVGLVDRQVPDVLAVVEGRRVGDVVVGVDSGLNGKQLGRDPQVGLKSLGSASYFVRRQDSNDVLAIAAGPAFARFRVLAAYKYIWILGTIGLFVALALFGHEVNGARLWFSVGRFNAQPVEIAKLFMVFFMAAYLAENGMASPKNSTPSICSIKNCWRPNLSALVAQPSANTVIR